MTNREYTIEDFKPRWGEGKITATGTNYFDRIDGKLHINVNYSSILTKLIQEAGRWCEHYASDLFIDWEMIKRTLENEEEYDKSYMFGFREDGVDGNEYVLHRYNSRNEKEYRTLWRLDVESKQSYDEYHFDVEMKLYRVA